MDVTNNDKHDSEVLPSLIMNASRHRLISEACMEGHTIHLRLMLCSERQA